MTKLSDQRGFVVSVEVFYLIVLFALALSYLTQPHNWFNIPDSFGPLPVGVPWFGALGAVVISLSGVFDHRKNWDPSWNLWHFTRPLIGVSLAVIAWLIFQAGILAVGSTGPSQGGAASRPTNLLYYVIAFVVGYREEIFRDLIKRVADVILTPGGGGATTGVSPAVSALNPTRGGVAGGDRVTITGSGLAGTTSVKFGAAPATNVQVTSDGEIAVMTPPGTAGSVTVTIATKAGIVTGGQFTYQ